MSSIFHRSAVVSVCLHSVRLHSVRLLSVCLLTGIVPGLFGYEPQANAFIWEQMPPDSSGEECPPEGTGQTSCDECTLNPDEMCNNGGERAAEASGLLQRHPRPAYQGTDPGHHVWWMILKE